MRIAYTTTFNAQDVHNWSGTPYHMARALSDNGFQVENIGSLRRQLPRFFKAKQVWSKLLSNQRESPRFNVTVAKNYSQQVARRLNNVNVDAIVSPLVNPIAYLDTNKPIILWTDAVYASLLGFYPPFAHHSAKTIKQGNEMTAACLERCKFAVFSSDWAANAAIELYGTSREKVKVIPFGANIDSYPSITEIRDIIAKRPTDKIKLLFLAKSWERKGGDTVLAVASALHFAGHRVELHIVGYTPPNASSLPSFVKLHGFVSKHTAEGKHKLNELLSSSHFLFVPSRAEAYGIVFCEANAFGVPCLTTYIGGIGTVVKDHINGKTFGLDAPVTAYCDYIVNLMSDHKRYKELALSAYNEFVTRLNWNSAVQSMKQLMSEAF